MAELMPEQRLAAVVVADRCRTAHRVALGRSVAGSNPVAQTTFLSVGSCTPRRTAGHTCGTPSSFACTRTSSRGRSRMTPVQLVSFLTERDNQSEGRNHAVTGRHRPRGRRHRRWARHLRASPRHQRPSYVPRCGPARRRTGLVRDSPERGVQDRRRRTVLAVWRSCRPADHGHRREPRRA